MSEEEMIKELEESCLKYQMQIELLKSKIERTIEYITDNANRTIYGNYLLDNHDVKNILEILKS